MKTIYPALFHKEDDGFWVEFPDLEGCYSDGDTLEDVFSNASEALAGYCVTLFEQKQKLPPASSISDIPADSDSFTSYVTANFISKSKAVKKTLTIPSWLNDMAEEKGINFSGTLQNALMKELNLA